MALENCSMALSKSLAAKNLLPSALNSSADIVMCFFFKLLVVVGWDQSGDVQANIYLGRVRTSAFLEASEKLFGDEIGKHRQRMCKII